MTAMNLAGCNSILDKFSEREQTQIGTKGVYLSGGEKQRIAIARAILKDAKIIIMDEPTTALTETEVEQLYKIIDTVKRRGIAIIFISHKLQEVLDLSDNAKSPSSGICCPRFSITRHFE